MSSYENALAALAEVSDIICNDAAEWLIDNVETIEEVLPDASTHGNLLRILLPCSPQEMATQPVPYDYSPNGDDIYLTPRLVLNNLSSEYDVHHREALMDLLAEIYREDSPYTVNEYVREKPRSWREVLLGQPAQSTASYVWDSRLSADSDWKSWEIHLQDI